MKIFNFEMKMKMNFIQTTPNRDPQGGISRADPPCQFHIDKPIHTPQRSGLVVKHVYLHHFSVAVFSTVFNAVDSDWLALSPAHSLDSDWLAAG